jgi:RNA polymerase sigma factor (sigma-70 family)
VASEIAMLTDRLLSEVATREPLDREEEARLARLVTEGKAALERLAEPDLAADERQRLEELSSEGREALGTLITHHLPLVVGMTRRYRWSGIPILDLFQEGVLGLIRAAERFDWTRGTPFGAYASWWVRHAMSRAVRDATTSVHLSDGQHAVLRRLARARADDPTASWDTLAKRAGVEAQEARNLVPLLGPPVSFEAPIRPGVDVSMAELLADREAEEAMDEVLVSAEAHRLLHMAARELTPRERRILEARYGLGGVDPKTLREVGVELGLTAQRVAQIEERALRKLRGALGVDPAQVVGRRGRRGTASRPTDAA